MRRTILVSLLALACLGAGYDRGDWRHWTDRNGDCRDSRQEVLIRDADGPVALSESGCSVDLGRWVCPYTGEVFSDPRRLDVDHIVPLADAYDSGGWAWTAEKREGYANWEPGLLAVSAGSNRSKGAQSPDQWLPEHMDPCEYVRRWVAVKRQWGLRLKVRVAEMWLWCQVTGAPGPATAD